MSHYHFKKWVSMVQLANVTKIMREHSRVGPKKKFKKPLFSNAHAFLKLYESILFIILMR